jgi:hypothetical protein
MPTIDQHLETLRAFHTDRFAHTDLPWSEERPHLILLGRRMTKWAATIDVESTPVSLEDAVVRAAACIIKAAQRGQQLVGVEVLIFPPEQVRWEGSGAWRLCWEAGPQGWGVSDSMEGGFVVPSRYALHPKWGWHTECEFSFDLCYFKD